MPLLRTIELSGGPDDGYRGNCPDGCCMTLGPSRRLYAETGEITNDGLARVFRLAHPAALGPLGRPVEDTRPGIL